MDDLISREAMLEVMKKSTYVTSKYFDVEGRDIGNTDGREWIERRRVFNVINGAPAMDAEPVRHGRWIKKIGCVKCSTCFEDCWADSAPSYEFCPYCGAKMDMEKEDE